MAALCEAFTLCGLLSGTEDRRQHQQEGDGLQGVEEAAEPDTVLVTDSGRTVTVYKVSDQRPLGSWAVRQGQRITCPAVYNHSSGEFVVVYDEKVVRVWRADDVSLDKVFKATLSADVCRVLSLPDDEPLVLFRGGALRYLDALLANPQQEIETIVTEGENIIWSRALSGGGQPLIIFITEKPPDWFVYTWRPAFSACQRWRLPPAMDCSRLLDYSAVIKNNLVSLVLLYSSGHVRHCEVPLSPSDQEGVPELLLSPLLQLPEAVDSGAVVILHDSYIATLTPSAAELKDRLCIWNTSFQTLQDCKAFSRKTWLQLWSQDGKLYIPHASSLLVIRFTCEASSLASALGKGKSAPGAVSIVNWEALTGTTESLKPATGRETPRAKKTLSSEKEPAPSLEVLQTAPEHQIPSLVQRIWAVKELGRFQEAVSSAAQRLVTRCKNEPNFYPQSAFIKLIESGMLSYSLCPGLLPLCLEKQDIRGAQLCLEQLVDVPEGVLCSCLKSFLSVGEDVLSAAVLSTQSAASYVQETGPCPAAMDPVTQNGFSSPVVEEDGDDVHVKVLPRAEAQHCPVSLRRAVLLNSVLMSPFSESFLLPHLKDLTSEQVILLLRYLHYLYKKCSENLELSLPGEGRLSVTQILDWMNLILDANFTVLVLLPKAKTLLRSLQKYVRCQVKFFSELSTIEGSLSELQKLQTPQRSRGRYCIEVLELY
ncbi:nucleolar protein 11 [Dendrobates tinctorius]|uniref:nucleolar protein 11 n=1 Tax=Dendrobates tinctorius TaxID=92724 RepID=UPI003CC9902A